MTFYIQHGYGKAQKIPSVLADGNLAGIILSPGDEDPGALGDTARYCRDNGLEVLVDPQAYLYSTQPQGAGRQHEKHGLLLPQLSWAQDAQSVASFVNRVGDLNRVVTPDGSWIAPGPLQETFLDHWAPLSVQFSRTASQAWGEEKTIATLSVGEAGLAQWSEIERWLDVATTLPVKGFYLLINRPSTSYPPMPWAPIRLANLLRLIHVLGPVNEFEVIIGFSDFEGLLGIAAGADSMASGWSYTLRQFSSTKWMSPPSGGRPATVRTHMSRLWSLPRAEPEVAPLFHSELRNTLFSEDEVLKYQATEFSTITRAEAQVDHMKALAAKAAELSAEPKLSVRLEKTSSSLQDAISLFKTIEDVGLLAEPADRNRVIAYREALALFSEHVAL